MPRPGPRPYECVRRAWHSDRHQPIRGSIIQQVFRVVTEAHSSTTRKNREWQEKLPRVVLKAEEIMYSKANSEAEYTDPDTLWERLNDAINTIIRRDESTETGQCLQPCIEAALILGCVPVKASRSQRHSNPRSYLSSRFQESTQATPAVPDETNNHGPLPQPPTPSGNQLSLSRSTMGNQANSHPQSTNQMVLNTSYIATHTGPHLQESFPRPTPSMAFESNSLPNLGAVYPLYFGNLFQNVESQFGIQSAQNLNPENIIIGRPVGWPGGQSGCFTCTRNLLPDGSGEIAAGRREKMTLTNSHGKAAQMDCDLSLRLGLSDPCTSVKRLGSWSNDGGSSSYQEDIKNSEPSTKNLEFCFLPRRNTDYSKSCDNRLERKDDVLYKNTTSGKRKAPDLNELGDRSTQWLPEFKQNLYDGKIRWPGW